MISIESEERPWGRFFVLHDEPKYKLKRIEVDPGGKLSYQYHQKRSEAWTLVEGTGTITLDGREKKFKAKTKKIGHSLFCFCFTFIPPIIVLYAIERTYLGDLNFISDYASWFKWGSGIWIFAGLGYAQKHDLFQSLHARKLENIHISLCSPPLEDLLDSRVGIDTA